MRSFWICLTSVGISLSICGAPAQAEPVTTAKVIAGVKFLMENKDTVLNAIQPFLNNKEGKSQEVRPFSALKATRMVVSEQSMIVGVMHWHENTFGRAEMHSEVPYKVLYSIDLREVRCSYAPANKILHVLLPPTRIEATAVNHGQIKRRYVFGGMRSWSTSGIKLHFERHLLPDAQGEAEKTARKNLPGMDEMSRSSLRPFLTDLVRGIDPDIRIQIDN